VYRYTGHSDAPSDGQPDGSKNAKLGRRPKLTDEQVHQIDQWWERRKISVTVMARILHTSRDTVYDAATRRRGYRDRPRSQA
jgi:transposase